MADESGERPMAFGTLYRALGRLERMGLLESRWEDPQVPAKEGRPGRRLYALTATGQVAVREAAQALAEGTPQAIPERPVPA
jgi:DNA-binding PadR family transcriptional regulator